MAIRRIFNGANMYLPGGAYRMYSENWGLLWMLVKLKVISMDLALEADFNMTKYLEDGGAR